ncbi:hypothetical protein GOP47_0006704 [Adiantum capillus-veneris]|uniref:DYW domain-containing protein n=1 Tax=Adiantum capillus-veneris TaxID=13818 RepID=A0A9D4V3K8_ADICA|nr:hypothetical protein GOP47_0006704 [Adiantum capillus-veneris]
MNATMGEQLHLSYAGHEKWMSYTPRHSSYGYTCRLPGTDPCHSLQARYQPDTALLEKIFDGPSSLDELLASLDRYRSQLTLQMLISISNRCRREKNLDCAKQFHAHVRHLGMDIQEDLGNYIVPMFVDCGSLSEAQEIFDSLAYQRKISWISLLKGYFNQGDLQHVLHLFAKMQEDGVPHSRETILTPLKACARLNQVEKGRDVHNEVYKQGLESDLLIGNTLVGMYAKCGYLDEATGVFEKLPNRDVISWNALMTGYLEHGRTEEVLNCLNNMNARGVAADNVTLLCCVKACCNIEHLNQGHDAYSTIVKLGFDGQLFLCNALIDMYTKCGGLMEARHILEHLTARDVISWTTLISGYVDNGCGKEALKCLEEMKEDGVSPNSATLLCSLKACGSTGSLDKGRQIQADIPIELYRSDPTLGNSLVDMYAKCGSLQEAQEVFDQLPNRTLVSWNSLIAGFVEHGLGDDALDHLEQMQLEGMSPNASTLNCSLKACGLVGSSIRCQEVHTDIVVKGLERAELISNTLVDVYAKCGLLVDAHYAFGRPGVRNVISWTALLSGYADKGFGWEALDCLDKMQGEGVVPSAVTMACSLKACSRVGAIDVGQELHSDVVKRGILHAECMEMPARPVHVVHVLEADRLLLGNALVDMYGKCGNVLDAQDVFYAMPSWNLISWNALITGFSRQGHSEVVFELFDEMRKDGICPDEITFLSILSVCSHAGLVFKARTYFEDMTKEYNVPPTSEHFNCVIDLLGRAGQVVEAVEMLEKMPHQPTLYGWCSVLSACRKWANVKVGRHAFECVMRLDNEHSAAFVLMFNIYMDACMWEEAKKIEAMLQDLKEPGKSWVELLGVVHTFNEDNVDDDQYKELHAKLQQVYSEMDEKGYKNATEEIFDASNLSCKHSERLAVACGLLNTTEGSQVRVVKNLRICEDCHTTLAFISKMEGCNIVCKDKIGFHDFKNGKCSCGDYW